MVRLRMRVAFAWLMAAAIAGAGCGSSEGAGEHAARPEQSARVSAPTASPEVRVAPRSLEVRSDCEYACEEVFWPLATGLAPRALAGAPRRPLDGAPGWWLVDDGPSAAHVLICAENEPPLYECAWTLPLEARVPGMRPSEAPPARGDADTERHFRAELFAAEGLLEIVLRDSRGARCECLPFDLRGQPLP